MKTLIQVKNIVNLFHKGLISDAEAIEHLDRLQVHGGFSVAGFLGFDYANQQWIEVVRT